MPDLERWPAPARRDPGLGWPTYAILEPLAQWLRAEARRAYEERGRYRVLDVGCGVKPYYPFFAPYAGEYVGVDIDNPAAELEGRAESLPVADASFDVVLCTQVLEHAEEPAQVVRELRRVLAPGGRALASTHGTQVYHPNPVDLWRWTHAGLERLFSEAQWASVTVEPGSGTAACLAMLFSIYVDLLAGRAGARRASRPLIAAANRAAQALDRRSPDLARPRPGTLFANFHVVAVAPGTTAP